MDYQNIPLKHQIVNKVMIFDPCRCEFCSKPIQFARYTGWMGNNAIAYDAPFKSIQESMPHICAKRPKGWSEVKNIPESWEIYNSDPDDDGAAFIRKKMSVFEQ